MAAHLGVAPLLVAAVLPACASAAGPLFPGMCTKGDPSEKLGFCDQSKSMDERAADLVSRLTLEEKQSLLVNTAKAVPRLGLPRYQWWSEGLHGANEPCVSDGGVTKCPTSFPAPSAMGAALNDSLYLAVGSAIGVEGRSISNTRQHNWTGANILDGRGDGLTYWAPNANMERDPRWGRNQEAPGEDPHLTSRYIAAYVRGLQEGEDPGHVQVVATCKHFLANELENSKIDGKAITRHNFDAEIPLPELVDYYLPSFKSCIQEGRALGIMCSYNAVNGIPMCANREMLTDVLRDGWGFDGYVTGDCGAIADLVSPHHFAPDGATATAMGLKAGCDNDCGEVYGQSMVEAVNRSILSEETVDLALKRLTKIQMQLGLFEPKEGQPYFDSSRYGIGQIDSPEHQELAMEAALQSIVLLKNEANTLPFKKGLKLALVGPHTNGQEVMMSNNYGERCKSKNKSKNFGCVPSPLQAITRANAGGTTVGVQGVGVVDRGGDNISAAVDAARGADAVILLMGIDKTQEGEEHDRTDCGLPGNQPELVEAITALRKPTVMVLIHGGAMCLGSLQKGVPAIVDAFAGGERGSEALAAVLFGDYNPSGKLPVTMYPPEYMQQLPITQMSVTAAPGRTHLYYTGTPEFAFGAGLSYSSWTLDVVEGARQRLGTERGSASFTVRLTNKGPLAGRQRVLALARPRSGVAAAPGGLRQKLWGYQGAELAVGESAVLNFTLRPADLALSDALGNRVVSAGVWDVAFSHGEDGEATASVDLKGPAAVAERSVFKNVPGSQPIVV